MANRAYLFCSDADPTNSSTWVDLDRNDRIYYDSRHNIPLSWFFFFHPADIKLIDVFFASKHFKDASDWQEPKFMADKKQALDIFRGRKGLLAQVVGPGLYCPAFEHFLPRIESLPGNCLCMDPGEVAQGDEVDFPPLKLILELIEDTSTLLDTLKEALRQFSRVDHQDNDKFVVNVLGYTYGDFAPGTFSRVP